MFKCVYQEAPTPFGLSVRAASALGRRPDRGRTASEPIDKHICARSWFINNLYVC